MAAVTLETKQLLKELETDGEDYFDAGRQNNINDVVLSITGVLASLAATVSVASSGPAWLNATLAAIPAACVSIEKIVNIKGRSLWYFQRAAQVRSLATQLKYDTTPDLKEYARRRGEQEVEMERNWPLSGGAGISPSTSSGPGAGAPSRPDSRDRSST
jgi:hypothetical protein